MKITWDKKSERWFGVQSSTGCSLKCFVSMVISHIQPQFMHPDMTVSVSYEDQIMVDITDDDFDLNNVRLVISNSDKAKYGFYVEDIIVDTEDGPDYSLGEQHQILLDAGLALRGMKGV